MEEETKQNQMEKEEKKEMAYKGIAYKDRSLEEKLLFLDKLVEGISNYLESHDVETEGGERFNHGMQLEIAMLLDNPPRKLKEEWVTDFDEGFLPRLKKMFFDYIYLISKMHRYALTAHWKGDFKEGDRVKVASFELFGPREKVKVPAGREGVVSYITPGEFCDIATVVLDDFSYRGFDFHKLDVPMRLDQLDRVLEEF